MNRPFFASGVNGSVEKATAVLRFAFRSDKIDGSAMELGTVVMEIAELGDT
jgi:hypothetical protein